ncbi:MAG: DUF6600 domain-containing protein [Byssovorax sp.]
MNRTLIDLSFTLRSLAGAGALALLLSTSTGCVAYATVDEPVVVEAADAPATVEVFTDELSPYGEWVEVGGYGRVWHPAVAVVGPDFVPYTSDGAWVSTDQGWAFESRYSWGWAPFHYGRWVLASGYGWVWIPDTTWGPAWVEWRYGGGYVGWAPMGVGYASAYAPSYTFVETAHFTGGDCYHHRVPAERAGMAYASTVVVHDQVSHGGARWYTGPRVDVIERDLGAPIRRSQVTPPRPGRVVSPHATRSSGNFQAVPHHEQSRAPVERQSRPEVGGRASWDRPSAPRQASTPLPSPDVNRMPAARVNPGFHPSPAPRSTTTSRPAPRMSAPAPSSRASHGRHR